MNGIKVFFIERTDQVALSLRWYSRGDVKCGGYSYHNAHTPIGVAVGKYEDRGRKAEILLPADDVDHADPRWPVKCDSCDYLFTPEDNWQVFQTAIYRRLDTGETKPLPDWEAGAMWFADWMIHEGSKWNMGPDGHCLCVRIPGGPGRTHDWMVDARASNCDMPNDHTHRCWVRHGDPRTGNVHVDKNGNTCHAGAGSIGVPGFHGFLHNGHIVTA